MTVKQKLGKPGAGSRGSGGRWRSHILFFVAVLAVWGLAPAGLGVAAVQRRDVV